LANVPTSYGTTSAANFPALYVSWLWRDCIAKNWDAIYTWGWGGWEYPSYGTNGCKPYPPVGPAAWSEAVEKSIADIHTSGSPGPGDLIMVHVPNNQDKDQILAFQDSRFDPRNWTDADQVAKLAPGLWTVQSEQLSALTAQSSLSSDMCLYLLFLLTGLCTSTNGKDITLVNKIANLDTSSTENPNDTFADQLVYFALMVLIDPKGTYQWSHDQLNQMLTQLLGFLPNADPASTILQKTFNQQLAVLNSTPSYPMIDPYNPSIGFPQRKADTLAALNTAWTTLKS
jgi:hypothetical protein